MKNPYVSGTWQLIADKMETVKTVNLFVNDVGNKKYEMTTCPRLDRVSWERKKGRILWIEV